VVCRGFSSVTFLHEYRQRAERHSAQGQEPVMLYFGDFDPSGEEMAVAMRTTLREEMGVEDLRIEKVALTVDDITRYQLPHDPRALKRTDTRAQKHVERYGELAVELDALPPDVTEQKVRGAIEAELDVDLFNEEMEREELERATLHRIKAEVSTHIEKALDTTQSDQTGK
jgi:ADP-ribose pyrophosphatase YjhB (NUDIX family)